MEEYSKQHKSNQNLHVGSIGSWIMDNEERFRNIVKFLIYRFKVFRKEYASLPLKSSVAGYGTWAANWLYEKAFGEYDIEHPDFRYSVELGENGELYADWFFESLGDMFKDENGDIDEQSLKDFNDFLQEAMLLWIESLDGADPDEPEGYFVIKVGTDPVNNVVYPKSFGQEVNGQWVLKEEILEERYGRDGIDYDTYDHPTPKPDAKPLPGYDDLHVSKDKFAQMINGFGNSDRSLEGFMASLFPDSDLQLEPPEPTTSGPKP